MHDLPIINKLNQQQDQQRQQRILKAASYAYEQDRQALLSLGQHLPEWAVVGKPMQDSYLFAAMNIIQAYEGEV